MWQVLVMKKWNFSLPLCSVGTVGATCILSWPGSTKYWSESCFNDAAFLLLYKAFQSSVRTMSNTFCFSLGRSGVWSAFSSFRPMTSITWWNMAVTSMWIKLLHSQCSVKHVNESDANAWLIMTSWSMNGGFARKPCCMAGTMKMFYIRKNIFFPKEKESAHLKCTKRSVLKFKLRPEVQPITLLNTILAEKVPLLCTFYWKKVPLSHTYFRKVLFLFSISA